MRIGRPKPMAYSRPPGQTRRCNRVMRLVACGVMNKKKGNAAKRKALLLGLGLDNKDGHTRITTGENFRLIGGSEETHGVMQEKTVKMNEHLKRRGKTLDTITRDEFHEIADEVGMPLLEAQQARQKQ
jgi:hypothetical protein